MIKLFNTISRKIEELQPIDKTNVKIYTCGPTVYDYPHVGNWFAFIHWDLLARVIKASGLNPDWVMNITDVGHLVSDADEGEDKIEKGAQREGKSAWDIASFYADYFKNALKRLNFTEPSQLPRATNNIPEQIEFIKILEQKRFTYQTTDGIYFDTSKLDDYGQLAGLDIKNLKAGARVELNQEKHNPTDFALWKFSPKDKQRDMEWESPWGKGFPGWHLECSALIKKYLGTNIDIHAGGIDHIPVHHVNEIAQSKAVSGQPLANIWLHSNFVKVDGKKISKSLGNIITLEEIEKKGFSLQVFRLWVLQSHYRNEAEFSWDNLQAAQNRLNSFYSMASLKWQPTLARTIGSAQFENTYQEILNALQEDLNSPIALSIFHAFSDFLNSVTLPDANINDLENFLQKIDKLLGLKLSQVKDISPEQKELIQQHKAARANKDFSKSDEIRNQLKEQGIEIRDTAYGPIWNRV